VTLSDSNQRGLEHLRRATTAFIADDPTHIALNIGRATSVEQPGGGYNHIPGGERDLQSFKIVAQDFDRTAKNETDGAISVNRQYVMIGGWDSVAEVGDWWVDGGNRYTVTELMVANGYERKWLVDCQGLEPNYG